MPDLSRKTVFFNNAYFYEPKKNLNSYYKTGNCKKIKACFGFRYHAIMAFHSALTISGGTLRYLCRMSFRKLSRLLLPCIFLAAALAFYACRQPSRTQTSLRYLSDNPENFQQIDSGIRLLKTGDLVLRTGSDAISYMLRQMNQKNKTYSHCGIVVVEHGYPFIYHSIGGEDNPDERLRRDSASFFFSPAHNQRLGIFRLGLSDIQLQRLQALIATYYQAGIRFDMDFDMTTEDKLYCAEFVYKAFTRATGDSLFFPLTPVMGKEYVGVDDLYENRHAQLIYDYIYRL